MRKRSQRIRIRLQLSKQFSIEYDTILYDFCPSLSSFPLRQGQQEGRIGQNETWRVERADQILPLRMVHARLSTNRRINLGQQGGGNMHEWYAPQITGSGVANQIPNDATAKSNNGLAPLRMLLQQPIIDSTELGKGFTAFSRWNDIKIRLKACLLQVLHQC